MPLNACDMLLNSSLLHREAVDMPREAVDRPRACPAIYGDEGGLAKAGVRCYIAPFIFPARERLNGQGAGEDRRKGRQVQAGGEEAGCESCTEEGTG